MPSRRYLGAFLFTSLLVAAIIYGVARLIPSGPKNEARHFVLEKKIAAALGQKKDVIKAGAVNEPMLRWATADLLRTAPPAAIFGSSHSLMVTADLAGIPGVVNFSQSGASLFDDLTVWSILRHRDLPPKITVVFVDGWLFDHSADFKNWRPRVNDLRATLETLGETIPEARHTALATLAPSGTASWSDAFSFAPISQEIDRLLKHVFVSVHYAPNRAIDSVLITSEGAFLPSAKSQAFDQPAATSLALHQYRANADRHRYGNYESINEALWAYFEQWILQCQSQGPVYLVLSPYHPAIYSDIVGSPKNQLAQVEKRTRAFAEQHGIQLIGSYSPHVAQMTAENFSDGDHLNTNGLERLLKPLRDAVGAPTTP
ncbi:hypothetical protein [Oleiharenicola lentus]|uniref:hypothetical protein n=1 Tax=Oleiharenicola lentus TaxID=2508720 RepID=UPI003F67869C